MSTLTAAPGGPLALGLLGWRLLMGYIFDVFLELQTGGDKGQWATGDEREGTPEEVKKKIAGTLVTELEEDN